MALILMSMPMQGKKKVKNVVSYKQNNFARAHTLYGTLARSLGRTKFPKTTFCGARWDIKKNFLSLPKH